MQLYRLTPSWAILRLKINPHPETSVCLRLIGLEAFRVVNLMLFGIATTTTNQYTNIRKDQRQRENNNKCFCSIVGQLVCSIWKGKMCVVLVQVLNYFVSHSSV